MDAYSLDLRQRVAAACDEGILTRQQVAERYGVSTSFIRKLLSRRKAVGSLAAKPHAGGFPSRLSRRALRVLAGLVGEQPDATLAELRGRLRHRRGGVSVSVPAICRALVGLGLPRKKSRYTRPNATPRVSGPCVPPSPARLRRCRQPGGCTSTRPGRP